MQDKFELLVDDCFRVAKVFKEDNQEDIVDLYLTIARLGLLMQSTLNTPVPERNDPNAD